MFKSFLLGSLLCAAPAAAYSPVGYPGSVWNTNTRDAANFEGTGTMGRVSQGISWFTLPYKADFRTSAAYRWRFRSGNRLYFNAHGPSLGAAVSHSIGDIGVDFAWQTFPELERTDENFEIYGSWYKKWDLAKYLLKERRLAGVPIVALPFSTWGRLSHDLNDIEGDGSQGWVTQAVDWVEFGPKIVFRTFGRYAWRFRTKNRPYYNMQGPAVGAEFGWDGLKVGVERYWRRFPELKRSTGDFEFYADLYYRWDLKDLAKSKSK